MSCLPAKRSVSRRPSLSVALLVACTARSPAATVTYSKHIAPIFNQHCVDCHRDGQVAPFTLTSYDEAAGWAETIAEVVAGGRMPPWLANPEYGHFRNDARLSDGDKELICDLGAQRLSGGGQSRLARSRRRLSTAGGFPSPTWFSR